MPVVIGSKFTGRPAYHQDSTSGTYWETLPTIQGDALLIQQALLAKPKKARAVTAQYPAKEVITDVV